MSTSSPRTELPLYLGTTPRRRFGWYHAPSDHCKRNCGVVLCNPIGDDAVRAHRTFRHLAERLCAAGFPVLRFDFYGTGDSSGDEREPGLVETWLADLGLAVDELRRVGGVDRVTLAGLKLGATLATIAAAGRSDIDSLILWSPYASGDEFVVETTRLHRMHTLLEPESFSGGPETREGLEALGFLLSAETIGDLGGLSLSSVRTRPADRALVIGAANLPAEADLLDHLRGLGTEVTYRHLPGHRFLIAIPHESVVPTEVLDSMVGWLSDLHPPRSGRRRDAKRARVSSPPALPEDGAERPISFGSHHPLFGILTPPFGNGRAPGDLPAIVLTNAGTVHRIGPHRLYVTLARRWASLGLPVFRMDLSGIGDSPAADGSSENLCYPKSALTDLKDALDHLERTIGARRFIVAGLCSGGDLAFSIAQRDPRVSGAILINPRTFCVHDLKLVDAYEHARYYQSSLFRSDRWKKLLRGEVDLFRAARMLAPRLTGAALGALRPLWHARWPLGNDTAKRVNDVPGTLRDMAERGVDVLLLATLHDPGVDYVDVHFGAAMRALRQVPGFRRKDLPGTDHTFTALWAQSQVSELLTEHLSHQLPRPTERPPQTQAAAMEEVTS